MLVGNSGLAVTGVAAEEQDCAISVVVFSKNWMEYQEDKQTNLVDCRVRLWKEQASLYTSHHR